MRLLAMRMMVVRPNRLMRTMRARPPNGTSRATLHCQLRIGYEVPASKSYFLPAFQCACMILMMVAVSYSWPG